MTPYQPTSEFWSIVGYWQTIIAGLLAVGAAGLTIWATNSAAAREVSAANRQVEATQDQIKTALLMDQQRTTSENIAKLEETLAFFIALSGAMDMVVKAVPRARTLMAGRSANHSAVFSARQSMLSPLFPDLRQVCIRLGGNITSLFIELDQDIIVFSSKWIPAQLPAGMAFKLGDQNGFEDELSAIEKQAIALGSEVDISIKQIEAALSPLRDMKTAIERDLIQQNKMAASIR
jgi:hypothetical protein